MFSIADEDVVKVVSVLATVIKRLSEGEQQCNRVITVGEDIGVLVAAGKWEQEVMRIDIKINEQ